MQKFLDEYGLARVWQNIKSYIQQNSSSGVDSFNGRTGAIMPQSGDYTYAMVGAMPNTPISSVSILTKAQYDALASKNATTLYLIEE